MHFTPLTRYRLRQVGLITVGWIVAGVLLEIYNSVSYNPVDGEFYAYFPFGHGVIEHLLITAIGPLLGGLGGGSIIIFLMRDRLRKKSFGRKLWLQSLIFLAIISVLIMVVGSVHTLTMRGDFRKTFVDVVFNLRVLRLLIIWFIIVIVTLLLLDIGEKYGKGVLFKIITGKYHHPIVEERIFMFMDLTDSTTLTERLGDQKYFELLRSLFFLATEPILNNEGEIHQYVGDEIILSWPVRKGLNNANCIQSYFSIADAIDKRKDEYLVRFGVIPEFKAAVHMGKVVAGEIGVIKKDIVYTGDVLNSTSRILGHCRDYGETLLVTDEIVDKLKHITSMEFRFLDALVLRGKKAKTKIYSVRKVG